MAQLMKFAGVEASKTEQKTPASKEDTVGPDVVEQLRHRLHANPSDSLEVKSVIVGELMYQCYRQLLKKRYL